jgi:hypothetical protein
LVKDGSARERRSGDIIERWGCASDINSRPLVEPVDKQHTVTSGRTPSVSAKTADGAVRFCSLAHDRSWHLGPTSLFPAVFVRRSESPPPCFRPFCPRSRSPPQVPFNHLHCLSSAFLTTQQALPLYAYHAPSCFVSWCPSRKSLTLRAMCALMNSHLSRAFHYQLRP